MGFKDLKKGDTLYIYEKYKTRPIYDEAIVKSIRKKNNRLEILTDDEYWYIPMEFADDCYRIIKQGQLEIHLCSDISYFKEIHENYK